MKKFFKKHKDELVYSFVIIVELLGGSVFAVIGELSPAFIFFTVAILFLAMFKIEKSLAIVEAKADAAYRLSNQLCNIFSEHIKQSKVSNLHSESETKA